MGKKRIYELAKELNVSSKQIVDRADKEGFTIKNHMSTVDDNQEKQIRKMFSKGASATSHSARPQQNKSQHSTSHVAKKPNETHSTTSSSSHTASRPNNRNSDSRNGNHNSRDQHQSARTNHSNSAQHTSNAAHNDTHRNNNVNHSSSNNNGNHNGGNQNSRNQNQNHSNSRNNNTNNRNNNSNNTTRTSRPAASNTRSSNNRTSNNSGNAHSNNAHRNTGSGRFGGSLNRNNNNNRGGSRKFNKKRNKKQRKQKNQRLREVEHHGAPERKERPLPKVLEYQDGMNAQDLGKILHREPAEIVKKLFMLGVMVNQNQSLDKDTIEILAADYGIEAQEKVHQDLSNLDKIFEKEEANTDNQVSRPAVVTIMGHVDHGKTTLLDHLRHSHITAGEAGGITQAIGAYQVRHGDNLITFLDTPGHAAFTEMRARGANITDITVLVVAADDGVMPQTIEAINHAKAAKTPIIVAINKIDKPDANPQHVTDQLMQYGLIPEDNGGNTIFVNISAKFGKNIDELLDMIILEAEMLELKANPDQPGAGSVIEARLDQGQGPVATLLVQQGTLRVGDPIVVGNTFGRVRTMTNERGRDLKKATPATPVSITGLNDVPEAGDRFVVFADEKTARSVGEERAKEAQVEERRKTTRVTLDSLFDSLKEGEMKEVDIVIKADVQGSVEALSNSLQKIEVKGVKVNIIHAAVGAINESDVALAEASNAIIIGFNVRPTPQAKSQAESDHVDIRLHQVIYNAIDEVESAMKGMLAPTYKEEVTGQVEVRDIFKASKVGTIAGGMVVDGFVEKNSKVRLIRDGVVVYTGELNSLKRFKDDVNEVKQGFELGLTIKDYNDIKVGDVIEAYVMKEVPVK
ncbi:translation initiation factor IF-2 [Lentilactobacillus sp. IMAU92037]|uniref:translation initiation factor IF-2 n=1 Tax=Lentilactobacillus TaxID=2767893 RepID=UPI001C27E9F5|nr:MULTISPECIES: translation initiation factor IF-2 [Lentilactobacillus]MBU9788034.1 translation initiation factor IF-2 [Lentilactobacillus dabitei]MBV0929156.1 translation initiation factor IF-2 [Lentilactobacillus dabitei]MDM7515302.1 translation initiation factor IF-2 [Lentilactobacillus sp. TOM.63]